VENTGRRGAILLGAFLFLAACAPGTEQKEGAERAYVSAAEAYGQERFEEALKYAGESLRIDPDFYQARLLEGKVLFFQNRLEAAEQTFAALRAKYPEYTEARLWNLRCLVLSLGRPSGRDLTEVQGALDRELSFNPSDWRVLYLYALLAGNAGNWEKKLSMGRRAENVLSDSAKVYLDMALSWHSLGLGDRVAEALEKARIIAGKMLPWPGWRKGRRNSLTHQKEITIKKMKNLIELWGKVKFTAAFPGLKFWESVIVLLFPLGFLVLPALSCASGAGNGSWTSFPEKPVQWNYRIGNIQVTVDHVREEAIASQIRAIAETLLAAGNGRRPEDSIPLTLDIRVEQRSFLHNVELFNTIYLDCLIRDGEGRALGREYRYSVGKRSIISSKEQQRIVDRALKGIIRAQWKRSRQIGSRANA
jgi:hypothetical protein